MTTEPPIQSDKQMVIEFLQNQPDTITLEEIQEYLFFQQQIMKGLKDFEQGKIIPHANVKEIAKSWTK